MGKSPQRDPIQVHQRKTIAARRVGEDVQCACGEKRPEALIAGTNPIICARCQRKSRGHSAFDYHHPAGTANIPVTIPIPVNDHRAILTVDQYDWPPETLENPDQLRSLKAAAHIRGLVKTNEYLIGQLSYLNDKLLRPLPELLEKLAEVERQTRKDKSPCNKTTQKKTKRR
jgi:hypothetical protein